MHIPANTSVEDLVQTTAPIAPVRYGKLGESRVLQPYPLDRVAIIGLGFTNVAFANQCQSGYWKKEGRQEIWAMNHAGYAFNCDLVWSMHDTHYLYHEEARMADGRPCLQDIKQTIVLPEALEEYPTSVEYPLAEVLARFNETYFTCTPTYLIAFALMCFELSDAPKKELWMYGCDFDYYGINNAAEAGKSNVEYWLGRAREAGVEVFIPPSSTLMQANQRRATGIYGYKNQPLPTFDAEGRINGIKEFVDPTEHKLEKQSVSKILERVPFKGSEDQQRLQAKAALQMLCKALNVPTAMAYALLDGQASITLNNGLR